MKFNTRKWIIVVEKNEDKELNNIMVVTENEDDKNLFTCRVVEWNDEYKAWSIIVVWRYSLYKLNYAGQVVYFLDVEDILSTIE